MNCLYVLLAALALGCGDGAASPSGPYVIGCVDCAPGAAGAAGSEPEEHPGAGSDVVVNPTGGSDVGGAEASGGVTPTGGVEATGGASGGVTPTGGVEATGGASGGVTPTGGSGGAEPEGIACEDAVCGEGVPCCFPFGTLQGPYCASSSESVRSCEFGGTYQGLLAECTSPDDCGEQHCCVYYEPLNGGLLFPHHAECGNCADGQGASRICLTNADCAPGRTCAVNTDISSSDTLKTCRG